MNTKKEKIVKEKLPTAEELFNKMLEENDKCTSTEMMIEFAKMHVTEALKQASEKARTPFDSDGDAILDKNSILTAYDLDNVE